MRYWNADGQPAALCINGTRCAARLALHLGWAEGSFPVTTDAGVFAARAVAPTEIAIQLPGMDGLQAAGLLKADDATRKIPVIALTALAMKGDEDRIRAAGCDGYIAKPIQYREFLAAVAVYLGEAPAC